MKVHTDPHDVVEPSYMIEQRELGWPEVHPEEYCHHCGTRNTLWAAEQDDWMAATSAWAAETGREGILCPQCFIEMHAEQTGQVTACWMITPWNADPWRKRWETLHEKHEDTKAENVRLREALDELNAEVEGLFNAAGQGGIEQAKSWLIRQLRSQLRKRRTSTGTVNSELTVRDPS